MYIFFYSMLTKIFLIIFIKEIRFQGLYALIVLTNDVVFYGEFIG